MNNTLEIKIYKNSIKEITNKAFNSEFVMKVQKPALVKKIKEFDCEIVTTKQIKSGKTTSPPILTISNPTNTTTRQSLSPQSPPQPSTPS